MAKKVDAYIQRKLEEKENPKPKPKNNSEKKHLKTKWDEALNEKQLAFIRHIVMDNMSPQHAYLAVYKGVSRPVASTNAYRLLKKPAVKTALTELSEQRKALSNIPKSFILDKLKEILSKAEEEGNFKYQIEALDMVNKMMGHYETTKTNINVNLTEQPISFGGYNPDEFIELESSDTPLITDSEESNEYEVEGYDDRTDNIDELPIEPDSNDI